MQPKNPILFSETILNDFILVIGHVILHLLNKWNLCRRNTVYLLHINSDDAACKHQFVVYTRALKDQTKPKSKKTQKTVPQTYVQIYLINNMMRISGK